ncbi:MAG: hypothetical protein FWF11_00905, partial [Coriobacteriia bacterium]|nr:hypothetical protein [Coriobacteriia bacterium]
MTVLVVLCLSMLAFIPTAWAQEITVSLRVEHTSVTRIAPSEVTLEHQPWDSYGIGITLADPGFITPVHVVAEYLEQTYGAGAAASKMVANNVGLVTIDGLGASDTGASGAFWMFAINQMMPDDGGWGYLETTYPVQDGDHIDILGFEWTFTGRLTFFDRDTYSIPLGENLDVTLLGLINDMMTFGVPPSVAIADAEILIDPVGDSHVGATTPRGIFTNTAGVATLQFDQPGSYLLSAQRPAVGVASDITRPFALVTVSAEEESGPELSVAGWNSFRGNVFNSAVVSAATPAPPQLAEAAWTHSVSNGFVSLSPVTIGDYIYIAGGSTLWKLNTAGQIQKTESLSEPYGQETALLAAGNNTVFVPISSGKVEAFDADTLQSLWVSEGFGSIWPSANATGALIYRDGYLYGSAGPLWDPSEGVFFCLDAATGDLVWEYSSPTAGGFLWAGAAVTSSVALFAGDDGLLVSHVTGTAAGDVIDTATLPGGVRSPVLYVENSGGTGGGIAYVTTRNGFVAQVSVAADGSLGSASSSALTGAGSTSTPVAYRDRLYTVSGEMGFGEAGSGFVDVFDRETLELLRSIPLPGYSQSSPLLSTAGANAQNGYQVNLYVVLNDAADDVIRITDSDLFVPAAAGIAPATFETLSSDTPVTTIFSPGGAFSMGSLTAGDNGQLYFVDGQGNFIALQSSNDTSGGQNNNNNNNGAG